MTDFLLDTNHASCLLAGEQRLVAPVRSREGTGDRFGISITVLGELFSGAYASQRMQENLAALRHFLGASLLRDFERMAAEEFGKIQAEQRQKGRPVPPTDAQIAAVARLRGLTILTDDRHFDSIDGIVVQSWIREPGES